MPTDTPQVEATSASAAVSKAVAIENPHAVLNAMVKAFGQVKSYRAAQVITGTLGYITQTMEYVAPDTMYIRSNVVSSTVGFYEEHLIIGDTLYDKIGASWQKSESDHMVPTVMQGMSFASIMKTIKALPSTVKSAKYIGADMVNGVPTQVYQYQMSISKLPIDATTTLWIGADHLPYRADGLILVPYKGKNITSASSVLISDYNAAITITVPITR
jgi:hypothetical protein